MAKMLVTGGAGFIGSNLVKRLLEDGHEVCVLDNLSSGYNSNLSLFHDVRFEEGDIRDESIVADCVRGVEVIFHLAGSVGNKRSIEYPILDSEINVLGTLKLLEAARRAGVRKIVSASSAGIFGELKTLPIREDHPVEPDTPYGSSKLCMEKQCLAYAKLYDIESVCLRYFNVYGPNQRYDAYGNVIPIFAYKIMRRECVPIFGNGEQTRDFIHVLDVVQANIKAAMTTGVSGAFNMGSGQRITINKLVKLIGDATNLEPLVEYGPARRGDVLHSLADISAACGAFGFQPSVTMESGIATYVEWLGQELSLL